MSDDVDALAARDRRMVAVDLSGCWLWGSGPVGCYGRKRIGSRTDGTRRAIYAHRYVFELLVGKIPDGLFLDHLCRVRKCVNPSHLEPVTNRENCIRGIGPEVTRRRQAMVTHCPAGHEYAGDNLYKEPNGGRKCRACCRRKSATIRARKAAERLAGKGE